MSGLMLHLQKIPSWLTEFVSRCEGRLEYVVGVDIFPKYDDVSVLGRTYLPDGESNALVDMGAAGADAWIDRFAPVYADNPHVAYWIGPNEYVLWDWDHTTRFNEFHVRFIERMSALGHPVACGQINTGWPRLIQYGDPPPYPDALAPTLAALWAHEGLFTLHEYWPGLEDPTGNILRYRDTRRALISAGVVNLPNFVVTELGMDLQTNDPDSDYNHWGWRHFVDWPTYFNMLKGYSKEMDMDDYMLGASIFTVADDWTTFQINYDEAMDLADWIAQDTPPAPITRAKLLDVNQFSGSSINWKEVWADGYRGVLIRVSGPNADRTEMIVDECWEQNYAGAAADGFLIGGYHGLMPGVTGQAMFFVEAVAGRPLELGYYGDLENMALTDVKCDGFLKGVDRNMAEWYVPGICKVYTSLNFMNNHDGYWAVGREAWLAGWVEEYNDSMNPVVPSPFTGWNLWQYTNQGYVSGVPNRVCLDVYNGTEEEFYEEYDGGTEPMDVKVLDYLGNEKDMIWLVANYCDMARDVPDTEGGYYKIVELREKHDDSAFVVKVLDKDGNPQEGVQIVFYWDTAVPLPGSGWLEKGVIGISKENGEQGFGMGGDSYIPVGGVGPHKAWIYGNGKSEMLNGIGWKLDTNHNHVDATFQWVEEEPEPPTPTPTNKFKVTGTITVDLIVEALEDA